ncbi:hypothetical protein ACVIHD_001118 [Bradyrhizobium embrapense]
MDVGPHAGGCLIWAYLIALGAAVSAILLFHWMVG